MAAGSQFQTVAVKQAISRFLISLPSGDVPVRNKEHIAALLCTKKRKITLAFPAAQIKKGSSDCWEFALVFATSLYAGESPA